MKAGTQLTRLSPNSTSSFSNSTLQNSMTWVLLSLGSTITFAFISALDKILIARFTPNARTFIVMVGLTQFLLAIVIIPWTEWTGYTSQDIALAVVSGLTSGADTWC